MLPFWLIVVIWPSKHAGLIYGNLLVPWDEKGATCALLVPPGCSGAQLAGGVEKVLQGKPLKKWRCNHTHRLNVQSPPRDGPCEWQFALNKQILHHIPLAAL